MSVYPIRNIPATDHSTETALSTKLWACVSSAECGTCSCSTLLLFCILTQDAKKLSADPQRAWGEFFPPAIPLTRAGDVFMRKSLLAHVPVGRIIPPHCLHFPQLAFNGGPERIRLETHRMVCTKGMEPLAQRSRRLRLVIALAQGQTFRLKPRTRGNGSSQGPGLRRGVYDLILLRGTGDGWDGVSHAIHTSTQSPSAINALAASPLCRTK